MEVSQVRNGSNENNSNADGSNADGSNAGAQLHMAQLVTYRQIKRNILFKSLKIVLQY